MTDISTNEELTSRQHKALAALMAEPTIRKASEASEVPERTLYQWLKDPVFTAEYRAARHAATQQAIARVQQYSGHAAATLVSLMAAGNPAAIRLTAASKLLDLALKSTELEELRAELDALKAMLEREHA